MPSQVLYDGTDSETVAQLSSIKHVTLLFLAPPFASAGDIAQFAAWQGRHWQWGGKPGNFNLMVKQGECACRMHCDGQPGCNATHHHPVTVVAGEGLGGCPSWCDTV